VSQKSGSDDPKWSSTRHAMPVNVTYFRISIRVAHRLRSRNPNENSSPATTSFIREEVRSSKLYPRSERDTTWRFGLPVLFVGSRILEPAIGHRFGYKSLKEYRAGRARSGWTAFPVASWPSMVNQNSRSFYNRLASRSGSGSVATRPSTLCGSIK
jgi:hypothetical protein